MLSVEMLAVKVAGAALAAGVARPMVLVVIKLSII